MAALAALPATAPVLYAAAAGQSDSTEACNVRGNPDASGNYTCKVWETAHQAVAPGAEVTLSYACGGGYAVTDHSVHFSGGAINVTSHNWDDGQSTPTVTVKNQGQNEGSFWMDGRCVSRQPTT
jgi:hypothetical protein